MPAVTIKNLSEETHRALKYRADQHGNSTEAEIRSILEEAVRPETRLKIGTELAEFGSDSDASLDLSVIPNPLSRPSSIDYPRHQCDIGACETLRESGRPGLAGQMAETLYITTINLAELVTGVELVPIGRRKDLLAASVNGFVERLFESRILAFNKEAAAAYATIIARTRSNGHTISVTDAQIAAIAAVTGFTVATRDTAPFLAAGTPILNPWID